MKTSRLFLYGFLIILSIPWLFPLGSTILTASKSNKEIAGNAFWTLPSQILLLDNLRHAWDIIGQLFVNSLIYATVGGVCAVLIGSMGAFSLARLRPRGGNSLFLIVISAAFLPFQMYLIPLYSLLNLVGLHDSMLGMTIIYIAFSIPFAIFILRNYFVTIPQDIQDAANIDGASDYSVFYRIFLPLAAPALATAFIFQFTWVWNDFLFGLVLANHDTTRPVMVGLALLVSNYNWDWARLTAGTLIASVPTLFIFIVLQRYLIRGITLGAVKG